MSESAPELEVFTPSKVSEAVQVLSEVGEEACILAGGTELMTRFRDPGSLPTGFLLDVSGLEPELRRIDCCANEIRIGALSTITDLVESELLAREAKPLNEAARCFGSKQIRNRATLGGNIMSGSPAADSLPALLALDARVTLLSSEGPRTVPLFSFHADYRRPVAKPSELLVEVRLPRRQARTVDLYRRVAPRRALATARVILAARAWDLSMSEGELRIGGLRLAAGAVAPTPMRLFETERVLLSEPLTPRLVHAAVTALRSEITPIDDLRSTAAYRRLVTGQILDDFLARLPGEA